MSKASKRRSARGETWLVLDRTAARRLAFEEGLRLVSESASFRELLIEGSQENWKGMAILNKAEKKRVRENVLEFAKASAADRRKAFEPQKIGFVERVKQAFQEAFPGA